MISDEIAFRPYNKDDENFIFSSWLNSYHKGSNFCKNLTFPIYYSYHHLVVERFFMRPGHRILIVHPKSDPDLILGYIAFEGKMIHYVYVKEAFRGDELGSLLLKEAGLGLEGTIITHLTHRCEHFLSTYGMIFNPYLM